MFMANFLLPTSMSGMASEPGWRGRGGTSVHVGTVSLEILDIVIMAHALRKRKKQ